MAEEDAAGTGHIETVAGEKVTIEFEGGKCIHARFCVTGTPKSFLANVEGPWIRPDATDAEKLVAVAEQCPSGAIQYRRTDGRPSEAPPPVNLLAVREAGPYAVRGDIRIGGKPVGYRRTLCRCGASRHKPYCDGSHTAAGFTASGEPETANAVALEVRDGPLEFEPQIDGPLKVRGNLEIMSGTGRTVARVKGCYLCRCGHSKNKPFCDSSHKVVGFRS